MIKLNEAVGMRIDEILRQKGWSIGRLAESSKIDKSNLSKIISGEIECRCPTVEKICDGLNVTVAYFFCSPLFDEGLKFECQSLGLQRYFDGNLKTDLLNIPSLPPPKEKE